MRSGNFLHYYLDLGNTHGRGLLSTIRREINLYSSELKMLSPEFAVSRIEEQARELAVA